MTMIEKMARAICGTQPHMQSLKKINAKAWFSEVDSGWRDHIDQARAALTAMLEPTEAMVALGYAEDTRFLRSCRQTYQAMIRSALDEGRV